MYNIVDKAGGAILIYYIGTVENCNFTNNSADVGGAVMFYDNSEMTNCNFNNNSASSGGAVYFLEGGKLTNSNFTNNFAGLNGGAVYIKEDGIVENCNFNGNNASGGGAIRILENSTVKNSNFNDNYASVGGAIFINDDGVVSGCIFVNNSANNGTIYYNNTEYGSNLTISDNIFLNNEGVAIYFVKQDSTSNVDYNWFGNNATNYDIEPINTNVEINAWLFLNATANPDAISILDSSDIIFKLYAYTPSGVSEYDNSRLKAVNLTLTPTNGRVNTTKTELGEHVQYTAEVGRMGKLTASIENASYTISLLISDGTTFYDLNRTINGNDNDTIVLDRDYTYNSTFDYNLNNGIVINRPVTIIGNGHTLNASGLARIFNIQADNVVIENITFTNAEAEHYGGAICWSGVNGNLSGCNFANNSVTYDGGAIFWNVTGGGSISDCSFVDNSAVEGGALFLNAGAGTLVSECSFMNNTANHGGAIFCDSCVGDVVSGCSFVNNTASVGGAICWWSSNEGLVSGCSFVNNFARYYGTAIFVNNATDGVVSGCIFVNNSADKGTIYFDNEEYGSNLTINDNIFLNNDGVAIYFVNSDSTSNADFNWFGNNATNYDIAPITHNIEIGTWLFLNATANPDKIPIFDSSEIMFKLYAYTHSGVSEYDNSHLNAVNLTLTSTNGRVNTARTELGETVYYTAESAGIGKLTAEIENASHTISLPISDGTTFLDLNHVINGNDNDTVVLDRDYTYNPTFDYDLNDGIVIDRPVTIIGNGHIIDATGLARIFNVQADNVTIENITFTNAKAQRAGGAIYWTGANGNVSDCDFVNNSANYAAAIWWDGAYGVVSDCDFVNNSAYAVGAIWWYAHDGALSGCSFVNNSAESSGGAISWNGANSNVSDCIFVNNTADSAGAIDWNNQYGIVSGCSFVNNSANNAGAIRWTTNYGVVSGCSFVNNSAADGIIYFGNKYYGSNLSINDNIFLNNDGVAIYFEEIDSTSNADYNWFGNNATNHDMEPVTHNVEIGTWLFLNATADPVSISVSESSDILFKLYSYDSTGVADYDDSKLPVVNLTLTTNNGVVNESSVVLGDSVEFTYNGGGDASVTAAIENAEYTIVLDVAKTDTILLVDDLNMSYKDGSKLVVRLLDGDNNPISNALIYVNNTVVIYKYRTDADGVANVPVNLKPNKYTYNIIYEGDADYNAANATRTVVVNKLNVTLDATDFVVGYKDGSNFTATLTDADGNGISNVTVKFDNGVNAYRYRTDDNGVARAPIKLKPGTYTYVISFAGNGVYAPANITKTLTVEKATPKLEASNVTVEYKNGNLTARLTDADGNAIVGATIRFDNGINSYRYRTDDNGVATAPVNLKPGQYNYTISFEENSLYGSVNTTASVKVNKVDTVLTADNISMTFKDGTNYTARLADANGNAIAGVIVKVNNTVATYKYKTDADGYIHAPINLRLGEYAFTAFIEDSDIYNPCNVTSTVVITR